MDNKRLIIALALSLLVLFGWSYIFPPEEPKAPAAAPEAKLEAKTEAKPASDPTAAAAPVPASQGRRVKVATPLFTADFNTQGGVLQRFELAKFREGIEANSPFIDMIGEKGSQNGALGVVLQPGTGEVHTWNSPNWTSEAADAELSAGQSKTFSFVGEAAGLKLERKLTVSADSYLVTEELVVTNPGTVAIKGHMSFTAASQGLSPKGEDKYNPTRISWHKVKGGYAEETSQGDLEKKGVKTEKADEKLDWAAIESNYFLLAIMPEVQDVSFNGRLKDDTFRLAVNQALELEPGASKVFKCSYYLGPSDRTLLAAMPNKLSEAVDFGWFHLIAVPLLAVLNWFYKLVHNYGVAVILLTCLVKLIFWPLSHKSYKSMEQMKKLQPMMQKLREKHADDKERLNQEIMQLYKTYKVNPAGGCLPMVVQIPVFFGLYKALLGAIELRHASFITHLPFTNMVWLADLSAKDPYYITPLIMGATMFLQQKMTPSGGDPTQAKIMLLMPVVFTFLFLNFPAGLVVYWLVNNVLSIAQQWWMMRKA